MTIEEIHSMVRRALQSGSLMDHYGGPIPGLASAPDHTALSTLGTLMLNFGTTGFNAYCENQRLLLGWWNSKGNQVARHARELRARYRRNDQAIRKLFQNVMNELVKPLVREHVAKGGTSLSADQEEAFCAALLVELMSDKGLGNAELAGRVLGQG